MHEPVSFGVSGTEFMNNNDNYEPVLPAAEISLMKKYLRNKLIDPKQAVEVQRKNPNSPLYSAKTFEELNLNKELLDGIYIMGFNRPSKIQETALPALLADPPQNMIAQSQNGTGKTATFLLVCLSRINPNIPLPQALILSPTYELAIQTGTVAERMAQFRPEIKFRYVIRGESMDQDTQITEHVLLGTPGKILDWANRFKLFDLSKLKLFVLDEADVMIDAQGHQDQSIRIHKRLSGDCQMMLFSATYDEDVREFANQIISDPVVIRLRKNEESLDNIKQYFINCKNSEEKYTAISNIYGVITIGQAIIFCHTRNAAHWLVRKMTTDGHSVALLSGDLTVEQRLDVLNRFRNGKHKVMITTNVCARGIDVEQVTFVVNFNLPVDRNGDACCETYLHRIGRSGRFGKAGIAINMVDGFQSMRVLKQIEEHFGRKISLLDSDDADEIEKIGHH